jgi:hypothetical protein
MAVPGGMDKINSIFVGGRGLFNPTMVIPGKGNMMNYNCDHSHITNETSVAYTWINDTTLHIVALGKKASGQQYKKWGQYNWDVKGKC